jgi:hypothetical protein
MEVFRTFICPDASRAAAQAIDPGMFTTGLSADGSPPATYWISSGILPQEQADELAAINGMDTSEEGPFEAMARMGLVMVEEPVQ